MITHLYQYLIQGQILTSMWAGTVHLILQIDLFSLEEELLFILTCQQFPMQLYFTIMINKSQKQSLQTVGVDLRTAVFSHGQLYVALSCVTDVHRLTVLNRSGRECHVQNVVYSEVLESLQ